MKLRKQNIDPRLKETIDLYIDGELDNGQVDELWTELVHNSRALDYLKSNVDTSGVNSDEYEGKVKTTTQKRNKNYWLVTAVLILIAGAFLIFYISSGTSRSVQPINNIALNYSRSANGFLDNEPMLRKAIKLAIHGKVDKAVRTIDIEMSRTHDVHKNSMLLIQSGAILYNAGKYREALFRFKGVTKTGIVGVKREKAYWYLGNAYLQLGKLKAAKASFQKTYNLNGAYRRVVKKYLTSLRNK